MHWVLRTGLGSVSNGQRVLTIILGVWVPLSALPPSEDAALDGLTLSWNGGWVLPCSSSTHPQLFTLPGIKLHSVHGRPRIHHHVDVVLFVAYGLPRT